MKRIITITLTLCIILSFVNCQSNKDVIYRKYENLYGERKIEQDKNLAVFPESFLKDDREIKLMLSYDCFLNKSVIINDTIKRNFNEMENGKHFGRNIFVYLEKKSIKKVKVLLGDKKAIFRPHKDYNFISVCYSESARKWYIEHYDYPHAIPYE